MSDDDPFNAVVQGIMDTVDTHGWAIIGTMTENGDPITYTVGLTFFRSPELFIDSMSITDGYRVLEELAQRIKKAGPFEKDQVTQVDGHHLKLLDRDLTNMGMVKFLFGDNNPIPPTALAVVAQ